MTVKKIAGTAKATYSRPLTRVFFTDDPLRPSRETATQLAALLSRCTASADDVVAQMQHNLATLKDARLELRTAIDILADSNKRSEDRCTAIADDSAMAGQS